MLTNVDKPLRFAGCHTFNTVAHFPEVSVRLVANARVVVWGIKYIFNIDCWVNKFFIFMAYFLIKNESFFFIHTINFLSYFACNVQYRMTADRAQELE